jgi:hypothetical protein
MKTLVERYLHYLDFQFSLEEFFLAIHLVLADCPEKKFFLYIKNILKLAFLLHLPLKDFSFVF